MSLMSVASALGRIGFGRVLDHPRVSQRLMAQLSIFGELVGMRERSVTLG